MSEERITTTIEKLRDEDGFAIWKFKIQTLLEADDMLSLINGESQKPVLAAGADEAAVEDLNRLQKEWKKADAKVRKLIVTTVSDNVTVLIMSCQTAKEMWDKLLSVFEHRSGNNLFSAQERFFKYEKKSSQ